MMIKSHYYWVSVIITIYFCLLIHTLASPTLHLCRHDQRDALLELKDEFTINKFSPGTWNKSSDCCFWEGVMCDDRSGQVKSLNLSGTFLSSSLKTNSSLFKLQYLGQLDLGGCNLQGEIPSSLGNLSRLTFLDLSYNKLVGEIPSSLGNLSRLLDLDLSWNKLVGEVPASMGNLKELNVMRLDENILSGNFPISLANLTKLSTFCAKDNSFHGPFPKSLFLIPSLEWVFLDGNQFTGPIEFENTSSASKLNYYLYLGRNRLDGPIPASISQFLNLEKLHLSYNNFTGTLPDIFANATKLQLLDVSHNQLEGIFPKSLINCKALRFVNVGSNKIKDTFPSRLGSLPSLQVLILRSNEFYGPLNHDNVSIGFQSLRIIDISHNGFTGTLPPHYFSSWREMTTLTTAIFEYMIGRVSNSTSYVIYDYESMEMVNKGVDMSFERIRQDFTAIDFSGNRIHGKIPESIGFLKELRLLNLSGNALTNDIPWILTNLTKLEALDLSRNNLSGQIPQGLGKLSFLSYMNFSHNRLQGPVPQGTQFQRQKCSSFSGNLRLYGLEDICGETHVPNLTSHQPEELSESDEQMFNWVAAAIAYGPGVFCGLVIGYIFNSHNHERFTEKFGRRKVLVATSAR